MTKNPVHHDRTKYMEIDRHFIKEKLENEIIILIYIPTDQQIADVLTKGLPKGFFDNIISNLGLLNIYVN